MTDPRPLVDILRELRQGRTDAEIEAFTAHLRADVTAGVSKTCAEFWIAEIASTRQGTGTRLPGA